MLPLSMLLYIPSRAWTFKLECADSDDRPVAERLGLRNAKHIEVIFIFTVKSHTCQSHTESIASLCRPFVRDLRHDGLPIVNTIVNTIMEHPAS